jgi:hypothetical protein
LPHAPQLSESLARSRHVAEQAVWPVGQTSVQTLLMHCCPAAHAPPQRPQCEGLLRVSISQPSFAMLLQLAKPALQSLNEHVPASQRPVVFANIAVQFTPHPPQFSRSVWKSRQTPSPLQVWQVPESDTLESSVEWLTS